MIKEKMIYSLQFRFNQYPLILLQNGNINFLTQKLSTAIKNICLVN